MAGSYSASTVPSQANASAPGRTYTDSKVVLGVAGETLYPGRLGIKSALAGVPATILLALTANLPDAQTIVATFSGVTTADEITGVGEYRGVPFVVGPIIYATGQTETLAVAAADANQAVDQAGFTAGRSIVFTSDATTITATADVKGETFKFRWTVKGTGTISSQVIADPGIFAQGSAKPALGVIADGGTAYAGSLGVSEIASTSAASCVAGGHVDVELLAAAAIAHGQVLYVEPATGAKFTGTESATTIWVPPSFLLPLDQAASSATYPQGAAARVRMGG